MKPFEITRVFDAPREMFSIATFEDQGRKTFEEGRGSMKMGWTGTFEQFEAYLAR